MFVLLLMSRGEISVFPKSFLFLSQIRPTETQLSPPEVVTTDQGSARDATSQSCAVAHEPEESLPPYTEVDENAGAEAQGRGRRAVVAHDVSRASLPPSYSDIFPETV